MVQIIGLIGGVISLIGSVYLFFVRLGECRSAEASERWPNAQGQITSSKVNKFGFFRLAYVPAVEYSFAANGHNQSGKRIAYRLLASRDEKKMERVAAKYPSGAKVKVTYDPGDPHNSVLEPGPQGTKVLTYDVVWLFCVGLFCILINLLL